MHKQEFLAQLRKKLCNLPHEETEEYVNFYSEMIDDRMEDGLSEAEAVAVIGSVDEIASQVIADTPPEEEKRKPRRRLRIWQIVLLILSAPIWFSIAITVISTAASIYGAVWSVIISLWAVFGALVSCLIAGAVSALSSMLSGSPLAAAATAGATIALSGLCILTFFVCKAVTGGVVLLTKKLFLWLRNLFIRKEKAQ